MRDRQGYLEGLCEWMWFDVADNPSVVGLKHRDGSELAKSLLVK
jgi:hypothetical protein